MRIGASFQDFIKIQQEHGRGHGGSNDIADGFGQEYSEHFVLKENRQKKRGIYPLSLYLVLKRRVAGIGRFISTELFMTLNTEFYPIFRHQTEDIALKFYKHPLILGCLFLFLCL